VTHTYVRRGQGHMQLRLSQLRLIAEHATERERAGEALRRELRRTLGPSLTTEGRLADVARAANERLDALEHAGGAARLGVRSAPLLRVADHPSADVRRLAARLLPERFVARFADDDDESVRHAVAPRLPLGKLREMVRRDPTDSVLREAIAAKRQVASAGLRSGDPVKQDEGTELSDAYYESLAERLMQDYGRRMEFGWEPEAVRRLARSIRATSGVVIDEERLLEALDDLRKDREDAVMDAPDRPLREAAAWLRDRVLQEASTGIPLMGEGDDDPVKELESAGDDEPAFMDGAERLFSIREAIVPHAVRKFRLREGISRPLSVPVSGRLPHGGAPRAVDERVLDAYVRRWNERAAMDGEPVRVSWSPSLVAVDRIGFSVELR
jgi:hypothetical protein